MPGLYDEISSVLELAENEFCDPFSGDPHEFVFMGQRIPCVRTVLNDGESVIPGGFQFEDAISLLVRRNAMPNVTVDSTEITVDSTEITADSNFRIPAIGSIVTFSDVDYRVIARREYPSHITFNLGSPDDSQ